MDCNTKLNLVFTLNCTLINGSSSVSSDVIKYFNSWFSFKDSWRVRKTNLSIFCNKIENSSWTVTRNEKLLLFTLNCTLINGSSSVSSDVIKYFNSWFSFKDSYRFRNTDLSVFCNKNENTRRTVTRNEETLALYIKLYTHQRNFNRVSDVIK